jgi:murein DD-endopeptidase MepM/ murein hydrolase activator NlpD
VKRIISLFLAVALAISVSGTALADWPVVGGRGYVSQWYSRHHNAIDIAAECGTRIVAAKNGVVAFAGWKNNGGGWQVTVRTRVDGKDIYAIYAHMRHRPPVVAGQRVQRSVTTLGRVGRTGFATGCHLHLAIWHGRPWYIDSYTSNPWRVVNHGAWLPSRYS